MSQLQIALIAWVGLVVALVLLLRLLTRRK